MYAAVCCRHSPQAVGPTAYRAKDAPGGYVPGKTVLIVMFGASAVFACSLTFVHWVWNRRRNAKQLFHQDHNTKQLAEDLSDLTDKQRPSYRYPY